MLHRIMTGLAMLASGSAVHAGELRGPGRFCGYSPIIDLAAGEHIRTLQGGIHGGTFEWNGAFGTMVVHGIGWGSGPAGTPAAEATSKGHVRYRERRDKRGYVVALWNRKYGVAYFTSPRRFSRAQLAAIDRVDLFNEGEEPQGCKLRTVFSWEPV